MYKLYQEVIVILFSGLFQELECAFNTTQSLLFLHVMMPFFSIYYKYIYELDTT